MNEVFIFVKVKEMKIVLLSFESHKLFKGKQTKKEYFNKTGAESLDKTLIYRIKYSIKVLESN